MGLRLAGHGFASAYLTVPLGSFDDERGRVLEAFDAWKESAAEHKINDLSSPIILKLLGQADMAVQFRVSDFRRVFELPYPYPHSAGATFNWLYSVPVELSGTPSGFSDSNSLSFLLHLRMRREVYAYRGLEEQIITKLDGLLREREIVADIHVGLGWSDLLVNGRVASNRFDTLVKALLEVNSFYLDIPREPQPAFARMLSLVGFESTAAKITPLLVHDRHLTLVRVVPGVLHEMSRRLKRLGGDLYLIEGKSDFIIVCTAAMPTDFLMRQQSIAEQEATKHHISKLETHLALTPAASLKDVKRIAVGHYTERAHVNCNCRSDQAALQQVVDRRLHLLPDEFRQAVQNMMLLLGATLNESSICCDTRNAVLACERSLVAILDRLEEVLHATATHSAEAKGLRPPNFDHAHRHRHRIEQARQRSREIFTIYGKITDWHVFSERILRQRTVGSFDEILGQTDRAITYNGGVQKFLFLADALINDFVRRIPRFPNTGPARDAPIFATLYDSVKTILSQAGMGIVRVPVRKIFQLPLAVVDLWHEVGAYLFDLRYATGYFRVHGETADSIELFSHMADNYGDLVVYVYGFHGDWDRFMRSLVSGWTEAYSDEVHEDIRECAVSDLVWRAYVVAEFHEGRTGPGNRPMSVIADSALSLVQDYFRTRSISNGGVRPGIGAWRGIKQRLGEQLDILREYFSDFLRDAIPTRKSRIMSFVEGEVRDFPEDADLNDYFADLAHSIRAPERLDDATVFRMMAALGKSATNEYYRRQRQRGADPRLRSAVKIRRPKS